MALSAMGRKTHELLVNRAAKHFSGKGYTILKEAKMAGRSRIDLLAIKGSERIGIECQLTISQNIIKQKFRDYGSSLTKMIFIIPKEREEKTKKVLENISKEERINKSFFDIWSEDVDITTSVRISKKTKQLLDEMGKEIGTFGETYDDIIFKVLQKIKNSKKDGEQK